MNYASITISSRYENTRLAALCAKEISAMSFKPEAVDEIELSVVELVNNCIEHAYEESEDSQIFIEFKVFKEQLIIEVVDNGRGMNLALLESMNGDFNFDPDDLNNLPEGGFGLNIIKASMDDVAYERLSNSNHWKLIKMC